MTNLNLDGKAIFKAYPEVVTVNQLTGCFTEDGTKVEIDDAKVAAARAELDLLKYKETRQPLYPPLADLADAMYWNSKGDSSKLTAYYAACEKVKTDNPKPS